MTTNIQLLRSSVLNKRPNAATLLEGQAAVNLNVGAPGMFFKTSDGTLTKIGPCEISTTGTQPNSSPAGSSGNALGEQWLDARGVFNSPVMKTFNGATFVSNNGFTVDDATGDFSFNKTLTIRTGIVDGTGQHSYFQLSSGPTSDETLISSPQTGMVRYDSTLNCYRAYVGGAAPAWKCFATTDQIPDIPDNDCCVAVQSNAPTSPAPVQGDLWWDTDTGILMIYYVDTNSAQWVQAVPSGSGGGGGGGNGVDIVLLESIQNLFDNTTTSFQLKAKDTGLPITGLNEPEQLLIQIGGVVQRPDTDYTVSGNTITFTTAPQNDQVSFAGRMFKEGGGSSGGGGDLGPCDVTTSNGVWCWNSDMLPLADNLYDVGSGAARAQDLYMGGTAYIGGTNVVPNSTLFSTGAFELGLDGTVHGLTLGRGGGAISTNTVFGNVALSSNTTGENNVAIGSTALQVNTVGNNNSAFGGGALEHNTEGNGNTAIGRQALSENTTGDFNTAVGVDALANTIDGNNNCAVGHLALHDNTSGIENIAVGASVLGANTTANGNTAVGANAMIANLTGFQNTAIGRYSCDAQTTGNGNTALGAATLTNNLGGHHNLALGVDALEFLTAGSGNIQIGATDSSQTYNPCFAFSTESNRIAIGSTAVTNAYVQVAWTVVSDARDKMNIGTVPHGLDFVKQLDPISFNFKVDRETETANGPKRYGFRAQDILALEGSDPVIIDNEDPNKLRYNGEALVPVLVNAVKELAAANAALEARIAALESA